MKIALLSGGVGGARCALAIDHWIRGANPASELTVVVNVGDDFSHLGLRISPDIDSVTYHLGRLGDRGRGWGREGDTARIAEQIRRHLPEQGWFHLGDLDLGHSLIRTQLLAAGLPLSAVTARFARDFGIAARILPVTDDPSPTIVDLPDATSADGVTGIGFQEWWVRDAAEPTPTGFRMPTARTARPAPGVVAAIRDADLVIVAPSNPIVSIAPVLAVPGVRDAVRETAAPVIGLSPIIGGRPVRGWADRCLAAAGVDCTAAAVRDHYGARRNGGLLDGWLVDTVDAETACSSPDHASRTPLTAPAPLLFSGSAADAAIIEAVLALAERVCTR